MKLCAVVQFGLRYLIGGVQLDRDAVPPSLRRSSRSPHGGETVTELDRHVGVNANLRPGRTADHHGRAEEQVTRRLLWQVEVEAHPHGVAADRNLPVLLRGSSGGEVTRQVPRYGVSAGEHRRPARGVKPCVTGRERSTI